MNSSRAWVWGNSVMSGHVLNSRNRGCAVSLENTSRTKFIRGVELRSDPARESCFQVVHLQTELQDYPDMSPVSRRQRLHRHMHNEMQNLEIAAQFIADFPDAP